MSDLADRAGAVVRFTLGIAIAVGVGLGVAALGVPWFLAWMPAVVALYLYGAASTNGYLPGTHRWKARRAG